MSLFQKSNLGWVGCSICLGLASCGSDPPTQEPAPAKTIPYDTLSEYGFFEQSQGNLKPNKGVVPYDVVSSLWADHAGKQRFFVVPEGMSITIGDLEDWQFPAGSIIIKTFFFALDQRDPAGSSRLLETRLLILEDSGWTAHTYVWNDEQTEATRVIAGKRIDLDYVDAQGNPAQLSYLVPNNNQCKSCHERDDTTNVLGPITPQLNRDVVTANGTRNQLEWLVEQGVLSALAKAPQDLPAFEDPQGSGLLEDRARAYLHANCAHCHRPGGGGGPSGLVLLAWETAPAKNGVCKAPAAAGAGTGGRLYDIVPGSPDESIMIYRMQSTDPEIKMPELPNRVSDDMGVQLVSEWITSMMPAGCGALP